MVLLPTEKPCPGCGHSTALHFYDITGVARCLFVHTGHSTSGVMGLPYTVSCDCTNGHSETHDRKVAEEKRKREEQEQRMQEMVESVRRTREEKEAIREIVSEDAAVRAPEEPESSWHKEQFEAGKLATTSGEAPKHFGSPAPDPEVDARGMHKDYWVLSKAEREKGFVRPVRETYVHIKCQSVTRMNRALAETYAAQPGFYGSTYCSTCQKHYPVGASGEFFWEGTTEKVGT